MTKKYSIKDYDRMLAYAKEHREDWSSQLDLLQEIINEFGLDYYLDGITDYRGRSEVYAYADYSSRTLGALICFSTVSYQKTPEELVKLAYALENKCLELMKKTNDL